MSKTADLTGMRFGNLTVMEKTGKQEDRYWTWRCKCDCGQEIVVNTKRLKRGTISHCGCGKKNLISLGKVPEDLSGKRYGKLMVLYLDKYREDGKSSWFCQCDCGNQCVVTADSLHYGKRKSCGCLHRETEIEQETDLRNKVFGKLTALCPIKQRGRNDSVMWKCQCECGNTVNVSQDSLLQGHYRSCGCVRQELQKNLYENLTFIDNTCVEMLQRRKFRSDNTSGFRGVSRGSGDKWLVTIGLQNKRYYVGSYTEFDDAVKARLRMEEALHDGFVEAYQSWHTQAAENEKWAEENPFYFNVARSGGDFHIDTVFGSTVVSAL